jgi:hypothetical protein
LQRQEREHRRRVVRKIVGRTTNSLGRRHS